MTGITSTAERFQAAAVGLFFGGAAIAGQVVESGLMYHVLAPAVMLAGCCAIIGYGLHATEDIGDAVGSVVAAVIGLWLVFMIVQVVILYATPWSLAFAPIAAVGFAMAGLPSSVRLSLTGSASQRGPMADHAT